MTIRSGLASTFIEHRRGGAYIPCISTLMTDVNPNGLPVFAPCLIQQAFIVRAGVLRKAKVMRVFSFRTTTG